MWKEYMLLLRTSQYTSGLKHTIYNQQAGEHLRKAETRQCLLEGAALLMVQRPDRAY